MSAQLELIENEEESPTGGEPSLAEQTLSMCHAMLHWRDGIEKALEYSGGAWSFDDACAAAISGRAHVYAGEDYFIMMEIVDHPRKRTYHGFIACGDLQAIRAQQDRIMKIAKELMCTELTMNARLGWGRALKDLGWKHRFTTIAVEVE